ncbi:hypothetical protein BpHYR1_007575 [Brachionus plicatilis]|uniref:Uncharacterized protein n=1 Tax=Brachionus plicatilis TaxID=10195 RepID=A0A3M7TC38_BRAPC|nr:hypothetical protein BpHYR1_007575 [Brachionus plicatilis]
MFDINNNTKETKSLPILKLEDFVKPNHSKFFPTVEKLQIHQSVFVCFFSNEKNKPTFNN